MQKQKRITRWKRWAGMVCLLISLVVLTGCDGDGAGCNAERKEGTVGMKEAEPTTKEPTTEEPTTATSDYDAISNEKYAWWFKRNQEHNRAGCQEDFDISQYDGYYLDRICEENYIYLTFDCGYENGFTPDILDSLKEQQVVAAFFVTQTFIRDNVELVKRMKEEGHLVCNHTVTHPSMPDLTIEEVKEEILSCADYMKEATGYEMDRFIRPPRGEYSERTLQASKDLGYRSIFWSIAYLDYEVNNQPSPEYVVEHFRKYHHPGAIVLMHNVSSANAAALPEVMKLLKEEGYIFRSLYDLERKKEPDNLAV